MTLSYEEVTDDFGSIILKATDENGKEFWIPMVSGNADYEAYLNPDKVEHLTEIISSETPTE